MKTLIKILCLSVLWFSCEEQNPDVYGCTDPDACNFNPDATIFDNSCDYNDENGDGICDTIEGLCQESDIFFNFNGFVETDEVGNILSENDTTDWNCCKLDEISNRNNSDEYIPPGELSFNAAYPNPFKDSTNFDFSIPSALFGSIYIINQNGNLIDSVFNGFLDTGAYREKWTPSEDVIGGLYRAILRVENDNTHCFGNICYCPDNQNCDEICE